jgi:Zn-dependent peptidase ImmA (M78 family)
VTVKWERFAGSTDTFAVRVAMMPDPDSAVGAEPEEAGTWGAFQLWVDGQNLCAHLDQGEVLQSAHWYLLPLFEWLIEGWNALLHEEKLPNRNIAETAVAALDSTRNPPELAGEAETVAWEEEWYEWRGRHALRTARSGGLLPNVVIRRLRDLIEISWQDEPLAGTPVGFSFSASTGVALIEPNQVAGPLYEIISAVVQYLGDIGADGERVAVLRERLKQLSLAEQHDRRLNWLAGLRELPPLSGRLKGSIPEREMHGRWSEIVEALRDSGNYAAAEAALEVEESPLVIVGSCHATLLFGSLSPTVTAEDVRTLASVLVDRYTSDAGRLPLTDSADQITVDPTIQAWEQGYELAERIHADLNLDLSAGWVDVAGVLDFLQVAVLSRELEDRNIRACCLIGPHHLPTIVQNESSPFFGSANAQRFSLAHEFCHLLFDRSHGQKLAIASGPWAPRAIERRANAFAAMFLMPTELVAAAVADVPDPISDLAGISAVAEMLHMSKHAATEHLYNLTLMSESDRDELLRQIQD